MNGRERIQAALEGKKADRVPVMLHNFLMAAREYGATQEEYRNNPAVIAEAHAAAVEKYGYDGVLLDIDTTVLAGALGVPVDYPVDGPAHCRSAGIVENLEDVARLRPVDLEKSRYVAIALEAARLLADRFAGTVHVRGNCDQAAFSLSGLLRGMEDFLVDLAYPENHAALEDLIAHACEATKQFIRLMAQTGVDSVSNGDSLAGPSLLSPAMYREFALGPEREIAATAAKAGKKYVLHVCGDTDAILDDLVTVGADALELDYLTDVGKVRRALGDTTTFIGNIDPSGVLALGDVASVERATRELLAVYGDSGRFILNAGCAISPDTPPENLKAMIACARGFDVSR